MLINGYVSPIHRKITTFSLVWRSMTVCYGNHFSNGAFMSIISLRVVILFPIFQYRVPLLWPCTRLALIEISLLRFSTSASEYTARNHPISWTPTSLTMAQCKKCVIS